MNDQQNNHIKGVNSDVQSYQSLLFQLTIGILLYFAYIKKYVTKLELSPIIITVLFLLTFSRQYLKWIEDMQENQGY